jgi:CDP-diacylglycerol--serine O-phosphatidyltransferase
MNRFIKFIPNLLTLSNLFLGCLGIIFCFHDHIFPVNAAEIDPTGKNVAVVFGFNNRLYIASFMIYGAAIVDFLDGFAARWLNATSALGGELDSLADVVTFGVLPGCIYYQLLSASWHLEPGALYVPMLYLAPAFLVSVCAAFRLAKFNVDERQHEAFLGLATPAMAIFAASLPLIIFTNALGLSMLLLNKWLLYSFVAVFAWLMVSEIPMFALKSKSYGWKGNEWQIVFLILCVLMVVLFQYAGIAACILLYVITNILRNNLRKPQSPTPER